MPRLGRLNQVRSLSPVRRLRSTSKARSLSPIRRLRNTVSGSNKKKACLKSTSLKKTKSADRDSAYFNVLGTDGLVSTAKLLEDLEALQSADCITKLELEDIISRKQDQFQVWEAVDSLLLDNREWKSIKLIDCFHILPDHSDEHGSSRAMFQLLEYETQQKEFAKGIFPLDALGGCVSFRVKVTLEAGIHIDSLLKLLRLVEKSCIEKVLFGGGLHAVDEADIPQRLQELFLKVKSLDEDQESSYCTLDMILIDLIYTQPHHCDNGDICQCSMNTAIELVTKCVRAMMELKDPPLKAIEPTDLLSQWVDAMVEQKSPPPRPTTELQRTQKKDGKRRKRSPNILNCENISWQRNANKSSSSNNNNNAQPKPTISKELHRGKKGRKERKQRPKRSSSIVTWQRNSTVVTDTQSSSKEPDHTAPTTSSQRQRETSPVSKRTNSAVHEISWRRSTITNTNHAKSPTRRDGPDFRWDLYQALEPRVESGVAA